MKSKLALSLAKPAKKTTKLASTGRKPSQHDRLLALFTKGRAISLKQAQIMGIMSLPARISELRKMGYSIVTVTNRAGTTSYKLA